MITQAELERRQRQMRQRIRLALLQRRVSVIGKPAGGDGSAAAGSPADVEPATQDPRRRVDPGDLDPLVA